MKPDTRTVHVSPVSEWEAPIIITFDDLEKLLASGHVTVKATKIRSSLLREIVKDLPDYSKQC